MLPQVPDDLDKLEAQKVRSAMLDFTNQIISWATDVQETLYGDGSSGSITDLKTEIETVDKKLRELIEAKNTDMQNKINHILLGVDEPSIRVVVNSSLDERLGKGN
ncbi:MAG: hypothetical protein MJ139_02755 [Limosilactobacillus sp.]|nr:hypothetical protein [Limosilactobacillus sp.]